MHWHINFASALLGNSILCSLPRYTTVIDSSSSLIFSFSCCTCCLFIFVLVFVMFSLIMSKKRFWNFSEPWLMHMWHRPKYWGPIVTHTWLALDIHGIRHDTSQNDQFAWAVVLIRESSHRKSHFPRRYPDTFLFSPGDVNRLSVHLASVKKKKKRLSETEKASASDPEWTEGGYVVKFLLILDISGGEVVFRNKHFPLPWPSSPNRLACAAGVWKGREREFWEREF